MCTDNGLVSARRRQSEMKCAKRNSQNNDKTDELLFCGRSIFNAYIALKLVHTSNTFNQFRINNGLIVFYILFIAHLLAFSSSSVSLSVLSFYLLIITLGAWR